MQSGDYADMVRKFKFTESVVAAIDSIKNVPGHYSEFVGVWGAGAHQQAQKFRVVLNSSLKLWTYTSNPDERNARRRVQYLRPDWHPVQVHMWLAEHYPWGSSGQASRRSTKRCSAEVNAPREAKCGRRVK